MVPLKCIFLINEPLELVAKGRKEGDYPYSVVTEPIVWQRTNFFKNLSKDFSKGFSKNLSKVYGNSLNKRITIYNKIFNCRENEKILSKERQGCTKKRSEFSRATKSFIEHKTCFARKNSMP